MSGFFVPAASSGKFFNVKKFSGCLLEKHSWNESLLSFYVPSGFFLSLFSLGFSLCSSAHRPSEWSQQLEDRGQERVGWVGG